MITRWFIISLIILSSLSLVSAQHCCGARVIASYDSWDEYRTAVGADRRGIVRPTSAYPQEDFRAARDYISDSAWYERYGDSLTMLDAVEITSDVWAFSFGYTVSERFRFPPRSRVAVVEVTDGEVLGILGDEHMRSPTGQNTRESMEWALFGAREGRRLN